MKSGAKKTGVHQVSTRFNNLAGQRFGKLIVESDLGVTNRNRSWLCRCDCGNVVSVLACNLLKGNSESCGCVKTRHGMSYTRTYRNWQQIIQRCTKPQNDRYADYGGRGISVCERWMVFDNFYADMGDQPEGLTIDRINNDGNYEPGNCRWATSIEQSNNRRSNVTRTHDGRTMSLRQWARECGLNYTAFFARLKKGWPLATALETPIRPKRAKGAI